VIANTELALTMVASFATKWLAVIARFMLVVDDAVYVAQKIVNLTSFQYMKQTLQ
jgi:hypothetical protein